MGGDDNRDGDNNREIVLFVYVIVLFVLFVVALSVWLNYIFQTYSSPPDQIPQPIRDRTTVFFDNTTVSFGNTTVKSDNTTLTHDDLSNNLNNIDKVSLYSIIAIGIIGILLFSSYNRLTKHLEKRSTNVTKFAQKIDSLQEAFNELTGQLKGQYSNKRTIKIVDTLLLKPDMVPTHTKSGNKFVIKNGKNYQITAQIVSNNGMANSGVEVQFAVSTISITWAPKTKEHVPTTKAITDEFGVAKADFYALNETSGMFIIVSCDNADPVCCEIKIES